MVSGRHSLYTLAIRKYHLRRCLPCPIDYPVEPWKLTHRQKPNTTKWQCYFTVTFYKVKATTLTAIRTIQTVILLYSTSLIPTSVGAVVAREELELMLAHPDMFGRRLPLLVFANKCDATHALAPMQVAAALGLERITDKPWHICASNALSGAGLTDGIAWLARQIRDLHIQHH
ncbi:hypothetical protein evm_013623 [Chilo suppressalis]|nr:hypothetical protein evm_013623 [Chilo suppressalis]